MSKDINYYIAHGKKAEELAHEKYGGIIHAVFQQGVMTFWTQNCTVPDLFRKTENGYEAIEVKFCDFDSFYQIRQKGYSVKKQLYKRLEDLPDGVMQRVVIYHTGYFEDFEIKEELSRILLPYFPKLEIDVIEYPNDEDMEDF